jgi:hypothetical protein
MANWTWEELRDRILRGVAGINAAPVGSPPGMLAGAVTFNRSGPLTLSCQFPPEPGVGQSQLVAHHVHRPAHHFRRLLRGHAAEIAHFDEFGKRTVLLRQRIHRKVEFQKPGLLAARVRFHLDGRIRLDAPVAPARGSPSAGMVDQDPPHRLGDHCKEVSPIGELDFGMAE